MYLPKHFEQNDPDLLLDVMREYSFAMLVSTVDGLPFATHLPLLATRVGGAIRIEGHFARANPHWQALERDPRALVVFQGPHAYISPSLYQSANRVPTWNYVAVHAGGRISIDHGRQSKLDTLAALIAQHEPGYRAQFEQIDPGTRDSLLGAIVAFTMTVDTLEGKFKLGQNRLPDNRSEMQAAHENGSENERGLAQWMKRLGYWS